MVKETVNWRTEQQEIITLPDVLEIDKMGSNCCGIFWSICHVCESGLASRVLRWVEVMEMCSRVNVCRPPSTHL